MRASSDIEVLHRTAYSRWRDGDDFAKADVAREIVISLGGLRMTAKGVLITGRGKDATPHRRRKKGEIV